MSFYNQHKYAIIGTSALCLGIGLYYLQKDEESIAFDKTVHTEEKLEQIINEIYVESATLYCQKLRLIREFKESGQYKGDETQQVLIQKQLQEMNQAEMETYKEYKVDEEFVQDWMQKYPDNKSIHNKMKQLQVLHEMVFQENGKIIHMPCEMKPVGLEEDKYIFIYRKQQAVMRYNLYKVMLEADKITNMEEKSKFIETKYIEQARKRDDYQKEAMALYEVKLQPNDQRPHALVMREVYLDFYSKSLVEQEKDPKLVTFSKRLQLEQNEHKQIIQKICDSQQLDTYKEEFCHKNGDPSVDPMSNLENELSRKHSILLGREVKEIPKKVDPFKLSGDGLFVDEQKVDDKDADKSKQVEEKKDEKVEEKKDEKDDKDADKTKDDKTSAPAVTEKTDESAKPIEKVQESFDNVKLEVEPAESKDKVEEAKEAKPETTQAAAETAEKDKEVAATTETEEKDKEAATTTEKAATTAASTTQEKQ